MGYVACICQIPEETAHVLQNLVSANGLIANNKNEKKILFPARGLNRDRCIPLGTVYYVFALSSWH